MKKLYSIAIVALVVGILFAVPMTASAKKVFTPVTTASAPSGWINHDATVTFSVSLSMPGRHHGHVDGLTTHYKIDGGKWQIGTQFTIAVNTHSHSSDGLHTIQYYSSYRGNDEAVKSLQFGIDTNAPTTTAPSTIPQYTYDYRIVVGHMAILPYSVVDAAPNGGTADVTIKITNSSGSVVKTLTYAGVPVNVVLGASFVWNLPAGSYKYSVYAVDAAGNAQSKVGSRSITAYAN